MTCAAFSSIMILLECQQMFKLGREYFKQAYNYLDIASNVIIIMTGVNRCRLG